jgi:SOS-response transcriptional repressor LexA
LVSDDKSRFPIFVTLNKKENVSNSIKYDDGFIDNVTFKWDSKRPRKLSSPEIKLLRDNHDQIRISLFVQKSNDEGIEFYYVGEIKPISSSFEQTTMPDDMGKHLPVVKVKFLMKHPVEDSIYEYLTSNKNIEKNTAEPEVEISSISENSHPFRIVPIDEVNPFVNCVPLYDIKVAAGDFSELQSNSETEWIELPKSYKYSSDYFVCKITGESMNQVIPHNSWCLFRKDPGGSREGKIVLVQHTNIQDSDFGSGFTVKLYQSKKEITEDNWQHTSIILSPKSNNPNFKPIVLNGDELTDLKVLGVFVAVLS